MIKAVDHFRSEVATIRTGRASINILEPIKIDYYGTQQSLKSIAQISIPEAQTIAIQPFDPNSIEMIEKAILSSDLGLNPNNDGNIIRRDCNDQLKKLNKTHELSDDNLKRALDDIQEFTDKYIDELNKIQKIKEEEILE